MLKGGQRRLRQRHHLGGGEGARVDAQLGERARKERAAVRREVAAPAHRQDRRGGRGKRDRGPGRGQHERAVEEGRQAGRRRRRVGQCDVVPSAVAGLERNREVLDSPDAVIIVVRDHDHAAGRDDGNAHWVRKARCSAGAISKSCDAAAS